MTTLVLDGSFSDDPVATAITAALRTHDPAADIVVLRDQKIGNCAGDFFCWIRSPGICHVNDDNRILVAKSVHSDLLVILTPITFGGYSSALKRAVDHFIQTVSPKFTTINGEVHHKRRYDKYPNLLVIGWLPQPDAHAEALFCQLARRHGLNMHAKTVVCGTVTGHPSSPDIAAQVGGWLDAVARHDSSSVSGAPISPPTGSDGSGRPERAVLLVGSPRTTKSTSHALGTYMLNQLAQQGVQTDTIQIYTSMSSASRREVAMATLDAADLVVLAFPLYIDSLPAPVIAALERMAAPDRVAARGERSSPPRLVAIANCGFPEAVHNTTALAICAEFAKASGFAWAGGLALGGGEGIVHGTPLPELGGKGRHIRTALDLAAVELSAGRSVPQQACDLMSRPQIPTWLYLLVGAIGWHWQARRYGAAMHLGDRPYEHTDTNTDTDTDTSPSRA